MEQSLPTVQLLTRSAYSLAYQMLGKREDALDIVQDATAIALSHESAPAQQSSDFKPWFFRVVRNRALDQLRRQTRFSHEPIENDSMLSGAATNPEQILQQEQLKDTLHRALMELKVEQREIIFLKDYHGFSYAEIAEILGIPKGSVMSKLHRSRLVLRALFSEDKKLTEDKK